MRSWWKACCVPVRSLLLSGSIGRLTVEQLGELIDGLEFLKRLKVLEKCRES